MMVACTTLLAACEPASSATRPLIFLATGTANDPTLTTDAGGFGTLYGTAGAGGVRFNCCPNQPLDELLQQPSIAFGKPILVMEPAPFGEQRLVGMVTQENLLEFLRLRQIQSARPEPTRRD